jgi:cytochrome c-type biogenesis protein CcmF
VGFDKNPEIEKLGGQEGDIAIGAKVLYQSGKKESTLLPIFVIRGNHTFSIRDFSLIPGITINFTKIDPESQKMDFDYSLHPPLSELMLPLEIAENAPRSDFIVMEAIYYPGINLVWLGSLMMIFGLWVSSYGRKIKRNSE